jgi:hypothetical protein
MALGKISKQKHIKKKAGTIKGLYNVWAIPELLDQVAEDTQKRAWKECTRKALRMINTMQYITYCFGDMKVQHKIQTDRFLGDM